MNTLCRTAWLLLYFFGLSTASIAQEAKSVIAWIQPVTEGWTVTPLLNVGDKVGQSGYRMVGVPDGLGVMDNGNGTLTIL